MNDTGRVLVVTPHPDDAESQSGGTIARWASEGRDITLIVCTNGDKGTGDRSILPDDLASIREKEQKKSADVLGLTDVVFLRQPDQGLEDNHEFREKIVRQIRLYKPKTVLTVDPNRPYIRHRDHSMAGRVVLDAVFPYARDHLAYPEHQREGLEPHKVSEVYLWGAENPDIYVDVTETFETKYRALHCHVSQVGNPTGERKKRMRARLTEAGDLIGVELAEGFKRIDLNRR